MAWLGDYNPVDALLFPVPQEPSYSRKSLGKNLLFIPTCEFAETVGCDELPALFLKSHSGKAKYIILYFHGNACDIGHVETELRALRRNLDVHVVAVEYPGYGLAGGKPRESSMDAAAQAAFNWLHFHLRIPLARIVIWGYSVGTGVAVSLAAEKQRQLRSGVAALVLQSPFRSFCDAVKDRAGAAASFLLANRWNSQENIRETTAPLLLIHGQQDTLIPYTHSTALMEASPAAVKRIFLCPAASHHDFNLAQDVFRPAKDFLQQLPPLDPFNLPALPGVDEAEDNGSAAPSAPDAAQRSTWLPGWVRGAFESSHAFSASSKSISTAQTIADSVFTAGGLTRHLEQRLATFLTEMSGQSTTKRMVAEQRYSGQLRYVQDMVAAHEPFLNVSVRLAVAAPESGRSKGPSAHLQIGGIAVVCLTGVSYQLLEEPFQLVHNKPADGILVQPVCIFGIREKWLEFLLECLRGEKEVKGTAKQLATDYVATHFFASDGSRRPGSPDFENLQDFMLDWNTQPDQSMSLYQFAVAAAGALCKAQATPSPLMKRYVDGFLREPTETLGHFPHGETAEEVVAYLKDEAHGATVLHNADYFLCILKYLLRTAGLSKLLLRQHTALTDCFIRRLTAPRKAPPTSR
eukprot:EG_transcript_6225